ncbi:TPA: winged helix-turn-helix domain-containing protein, partial [Enterobacter ludwigii]|nr:winged helix-turn-helix domain-containing protein [Enterobacter ludwigii]
KTSTIVYFSLNYINTIGLNEPVFLRFLCQQLANKLFISSQLKTTMCLSSLQRVSNYLMNEYNKHGSVIRLERRELVASFLSISVRHLNRVLAELQENQIIELKNKTIIVKDSELLKPE